MIHGERNPITSRSAHTPRTAPTTAAPKGEIATHEGQCRSFKTRPRHLQRDAKVYVRQSTPHQVAEHGESLARQYALRDRATALGWATSQIEVIDDDLGVSGRGSEDRRGFQRLLADVAQDRVGLVLALEMSRLARNSRDWHNLFDLCAVRDVLLADEDGVYDPGDINDRLILGMKGIMSEMELHVMKSRLERGRRNKAQRGELFHSVPWGYELSSDGTVAFDCDEQVRATVRRLFDTFQRLGTAYAVLRELRRHDVKLPKRDRGGQLVWRKATETVVNTTLHHPLYAGAYAWGRSQTQTDIDAAGHVTRRRRDRPRTEWTVLLNDRAPAYITWDQYLTNQQQLWDNQPRPTTKGAPRGGAALVVGLLYCGRCGRKMHVDYRTTTRGRYMCSRRRIEPSDEVCRGLTTRILDEFVTQQVLEALSPAGIELSLRAIEHSSEQRRQQETRLRQNLERDTYEAERAARQYHAVEPENRLVARTLEARWEAALEQQSAAQEALDRFQRAQPIALAAEERLTLDALSREIPALWHAPETTVRERKEIVRCLIERVLINVCPTTQQAHVVIHWAGDVQSWKTLLRPVGNYEDLDDYERMLERIGELRRAGWRSPRIAAQLNMEGFRTSKQCGAFTADVVRMLFRRLGLAKKGSEAGTRPEPPLWTADALATRLKIPTKKVKDWASLGRVRVIERPFGGVWILHADERELQRLELESAWCSQGRRYSAEIHSQPIKTPECR